MSWSDFGNNCGFYVLNEDFSVEHIPNAVSSVYIKISVWGENEESTHIEINNGSNNMLVSLDYLSEWVKDKNIIVKLFCENGLDSTFEGAKSILESNNVKYTAIDNRMIKLLEKQECVNVQDTRETLLQYVDTVAPDLKQLLLDLLNSNNE
jgi:lipopolysaccharide export LptBFGC system permease protein LptF